MFNNPHNPTGRLFGVDELEAIAGVARDHDLIVISDEVWEHVLLGRRAASRPDRDLPGMAERTIKIGSAGKIFSLTGWKVGWMVAAPEIAGVAGAGAPVPDLRDRTQPAGGGRFRSERGRRLARADAATASRARATAWRAAWKQRAMTSLEAAATYFLCVDLDASGLTLDDESFAAAAVEQAGVAVVPLSAFAEKDPSRHLVRLCFGKKDETIDAGVAAMARAKEMLS